MVRLFSFLDGPFSIAASPVEISSEPMRSSKIKERCSAHIEKILSWAELSRRWRSAQSPFEVSWRTDVISKHIVRGTQHRVREGRVFGTSCRLRNSFGVKRNFKATSCIDRTVKIHRQPAEEAQLLVGSFETLCKFQRNIEGIADPFTISGGKHQRHRKRRIDFHLISRVAVRGHSIDRLLHPTSALYKK